MNAVANETFKAARFAQLPSRRGRFVVRCMTCFGGKEHAILSSPVLPTVPHVRIHSECVTGDVFGSLRCDCQEQLHFALDVISQHGGVLVYLRQEGRGIGLASKLDAYALQEEGIDTVEANIRLGYPPDLRSYDDAIVILRDLGISQLKLITNNPAKIRSITDAGIVVAEVVPCRVRIGAHNGAYLSAKRLKLGHLL